MGVESAYDPYGYQAGPSTYPRRGASYQQPIDLTDSPAKKRSGKRKKTADNDDEADAKPAKKKKSKAKNEEKRLRRWRTHAPGTYLEIRERALTQRMFVIDRERTRLDNETSHPTETVSMAGTTGNIYTITVDKVPSCNCPHAMKGNQCKHIVYVLSRVLRVPVHLEYQLAFTTSELKEIFEKAPPLPSETADDSAKDGNRKPLEGECPICCVDFEPENKKEKIVYCKAACGNNVHKTCFDQWAATKPTGGVTCPFCRAPWDYGDETGVKNVAKTGKVNAEGYVNVAGQLGLSGRRDYSSYNEYWVRRQIRDGNIEDEGGWGF